MSTEIELKYFVPEQNVSSTIDHLLAQLGVEFLVKEKQLFNCYFDTPEQSLRQHDIGLRVRRVEHYIEQTIKTTGKLMGSLHVRPEYNVAIEQSTPNLSLFEPEIWPDSINVERIQQQLIPLFETDFTRKTWLINLANDGCIELAYDQGVIKSGDKQQAINEIELELVRGNPQQLLDIAQHLVQQIRLQPGVHSKAARGYRLWQGEALQLELTPLTMIPLTPDLPLAKSFFVGLGFALNQLQLMIDRYIATASLSYLTKVTEMLALMRHGFWLYKEVLPEQLQDLRDQISTQLKQLAWVDNALHVKELMDKTGNYRTKLEYSEQLLAQMKVERNALPSFEQTTELLTSSEFNQLQLNLLSLLLNEKSFITNSHPDDVSVITFARQKLEQSLNAVMYLKEHHHLTSEQYLSQYKLLIRSLLTGSWFGNLFDAELRKPYRDCWLDIKHGINELQTLWIIKQQLDALDSSEKKLTAWLDSKIENLLTALEQTREIANSLKIYW